MNFRSIRDLCEDIKSNLSLVPSDIDLIVGVPRSGLLAAQILSVYLKKPFLPLDIYIQSESSGEATLWAQPTANLKHVLVVDDSLNAGRAMVEVKERLSKLEPKADRKIKFLCVYVRPGASRMTDIGLISLSTPRMFEWNIYHHRIMRRSMVEMENFLCVEPEGIIEAEALREAKPRILPTTPIHTIVTSRPESMREVTMEWLKRYRVDYRHLIMDLSFDGKARVYGRQFQCDLYFSNVEDESEEIFQRTGKDVYSLQANRMYSRKFSVHRMKKDIFNLWQSLLNKISPSKSRSAKVVQQA